jgi:hypothetical protein
VPKDQGAQGLREGVGRRYPQAAAFSAGFRHAGGLFFDFYTTAPLDGVLVALYNTASHTLLQGVAHLHGGLPMRIAITRPLFDWESLQDSPSLSTLSKLLESLPDGKLLDSLAHV